MEFLTNVSEKPEEAQWDDDVLGHWGWARCRKGLRELHCSSRLTLSPSPYSNCFSCSLSTSSCCCLCTRCLGLPFSEQVVLFGMPLSHGYGKLVGIQFKKGGSKCHYCVLFPCRYIHAEMMFGFLCHQWGHPGLVFEGFILLILFIDELTACLPVFFLTIPVWTIFHPTLKQLFHPSPQEQHLSISKHHTATKLNTVELLTLLIAWWTWASFKPHSRSSMLLWWNRSL